VVVWVTPPPVAVTVRVYIPVAAVEPTAMERVELPEPGAAIEVGLRVAVTPVGAPETERETAELNPPYTLVVIVELPLAPCRIDNEDGEEEMLKPGVEDVPARVVISAGVGLPHPVTRS